MQAGELHTFTARAGTPAIGRVPPAPDASLGDEHSPALTRNGWAQKDPSWGPAEPLRWKLWVPALSQAGCGESEPRLHQDTPDPSATLPASPQPSQASGPSSLQLIHPALPSPSIPRHSQPGLAASSARTRDKPPALSNAERWAGVRAPLLRSSSGAGTSDVTLTRHNSSLAPAARAPPLPAWCYRLLASATDPACPCFIESWNGLG